MTITTKISSRIAFLVKSGMSVPEAFDAVLGAGAYVKLASDLHDALTAPAFILTITDIHGTREEPYPTREMAERAVRVLSEYSTVTMRAA